MERNSRREAVALFSAGDNTYAVCDISHSQPWDVVELFPKTDAVHLPDRRHSGGTASGIPNGKKLYAWDRYDPGSRSILRLDTCAGAQKEAEQSCYCEVVLQGAEGPLRIHALVDSGNTLTEPISGAPVSVLDARIFYRLWPEGLSGFRVIPYHSVGKKSGILKGYPVPQMTLIQQGVEREYRNVYLAVSEEIAGEEIQMLLPPALLQETNKARRKKEK